MSELIEVLIPPLTQAFTYELPAELAGKITVGYHVSVPFGKRQASGFVIKYGTSDTWALPKDLVIKQINKPSGYYPHFNQAQLKLFQWVADYYGESLSNVLETAVPPAAPQKFERFVKLASKTDLSSATAGKIQKKIIELLLAAGDAVPYSHILRMHKGAGAAIKKLLADSLITIETREVLDTFLGQEELPAWAKTEVALNAAQEASLRAITHEIDNSAYKPFLLHGVTGSGKTEVYIEAVKHALKQGKNALIIVPEIALTPQLIDRFRARLGANIAVLHSALNKRVRWDAWRALLEGRSQVAIGARSAIFSPTRNLGLIIVDEEHDTSYKQSDGLRYNARDIALVRAKMESCPVILGSATPSLESYYNAARKKYVYQRLPLSHSTAPKLQVEIVDLNQIKPWEMKSKNISAPLFEALRSTLDHNGQAFILYNRRGFASYFQCDRCATVMQCPNCSVALTFHEHSNCLLCHYCSYSLTPPHFCPLCEKTKTNKVEETPRKEKEKKEAQGIYVQRGAGTERVMEELRLLFPTIALERLDRDSATDEQAYRGILDRMRSGETKILVGTQMIAKGHDLPGVTLVGVVDCDVGLNMPDFRAAERIFQLLTQASGRAGRRDAQGKVILQTRSPQHPSLQKTVTQDYQGFAKLELNNRKDLLYPPYSHLLRIVVSSPVESFPERILSSFKQSIAQFVEKEKLSLIVLGPSPAPFVRLKTEWRWHITMRSVSATTLHKVIKLLKGLKIHTTKVRVVYDLDPQEML